MTGQAIFTDLRGRVRVVTLSSAPSTALTPALRAALIDAMQAADAAGAVLIRAEGVAFGAWMPLDPDLADPSLGDLCRAVENCAVPVVVALQGLTVGPSAELALAAHARVAAPDARLALPDIGLGLPPGGGTSQRLPRIVGPAEALRLLISGRAVTATEALALGLVDAVAQEDLLTASLEMAEDLAEGQRPKRPVIDPMVWQAAVAMARRDARGGPAVVGRIIDCVEAALLLPPENGLALEAVARADLEETPEVAALRAVAKAERRAATLPPAVARCRPVVVQRIGLVGDAPVLRTLAMAALGRGLEVVWLARDAEALVAGRLTAEARSRLVTGRDPVVLERAELVIHAARPEADTLRHSLPDTAHLVLDGAAGHLGLGLVPTGRVCELALPGNEAPDQVATAVATLRRIGLPPLLVGQRPVLGRAVAAAGRGALLRLAALGVPRRMIITALDGFGARLPEMDWPEAPMQLFAMSEGEICQRWLAALANAGLQALDHGMARRPSDVDHLLVAGHGFPRRQGGPMHQADRRGLIVLRRDLRQWAADDPIWAPASLLDRLLLDGLRLGSLDG